MRSIVLVVLCLATLYGVVLQHPTTTAGTPTPPSAIDTAGNNQAVPDVYGITGQFDRIVVLRLKYETDLLSGLQEGVKTQAIRNAVIMAGIGSVRSYHVHTVSNRMFPSQNVFVKDTAAPADIASMNGYVIDGRVHAHITLADSGRAFGGHLEPGTSVFTFAIVTLGVFAEGIDLRRADDKTYR